MNSLAQELLRVGLPSVRDYALALLDPGGAIIGWRWGAEEIYGYSESELAGRRTILLPEDIEKGLHAWRSTLRAETSFSQGDRWHLRKDGSRIRVSGTVTAAREASKLLGFVKIMRDRTDLRIAARTRAQPCERSEKRARAHGPVPSNARTRTAEFSVTHQERRPHRIAGLERAARA